MFYNIQRSIILRYWSKNNCNIILFIELYINIWIQYYIWISNLIGRTKKYPSQSHASITSNVEGDVLKWRYSLIALHNLNLILEGNGTILFRHKRRRVAKSYWCVNESLASSSLVLFKEFQFKDEKLTIWQIVKVMQSFINSNNH